MIDFKQLTETAHATAKSKGFWDNKPSFERLAALIISELGEAIEADRKGRTKSIDDFIKWEQEVAPDKEVWTRQFEVSVKDQVGDELADVVIRLADMCGGLEFDVEITELSMKNIFDETDGFASDVFHIMKTLCDSYCDDFVKYSLLGIFLELVYVLAKKWNINLEKHIEYKMAYNATRERLHGKAY